MESVDDAFVYDKAGIDLLFWGPCRQEAAWYFLSSVKESITYDCLVIGTETGMIHATTTCSVIAG